MAETQGSLLDTTASQLPAHSSPAMQLQLTLPVYKAGENWSCGSRWVRGVLPSLPGSAPALFLGGLHYSPLDSIVSIRPPPLTQLHLSFEPLDSLTLPSRLLVIRSPSPPLHLLSPQAIALPEFLYRISPWSPPPPDGGFSTLSLYLYLSAVSPVAGQPF